MKVQEMEILSGVFVPCMHERVVTVNVRRLVLVCIERGEYGKQQLCINSLMYECVRL